jgi:lipopolysaccharide biosynthesis protein
MRSRIRFIETPVPPVSSVRQVWEGTSIRGDRSLCLFAHWDMDGELDDYVIHAIEAWRANGFDVVLVSTAPQLTAAAVERARSCCCYVVWRENVGLDFASWKAGFDCVVPFSGEPVRMVLTNDSVFGPFEPLGPFIERADPHALTGFTDSYEHGHHLQSYCLLLGEPLITSAAFRRFWAGVRLLHDKDTIIQWYELGISRSLRSHGKPVTPLFPFAEVVDKARSDPKFQFAKMSNRWLNPTLHMWDVLIEEFGFPFLKTELLKRNRIASPHLAQWAERIPDGNLELVKSIERHVARVTRQQSARESQK